MKAVVAAFNQEKALVGAFSVITNLRMELFGALISNLVTNDARLSPYERTVPNTGGDSYYLADSAGLRLAR